MEMSQTFFLPNSDEALEVAFKYSRYVPAEISKAPESCYEAEGGEAELITICAESGNDISGLLSPAVVKQLTDKAECWARERQACGDLNDF